MRAGGVRLGVHEFKTIDFEKGKAGIGVASKEKLIGVIDTLMVQCERVKMTPFLSSRQRAGNAKAKAGCVRKITGGIVCVARRP